MIYFRRVHERALLYVFVTGLGYLGIVQLVLHVFRAYVLVHPLLSGTDGTFSPFSSAVSVVELLWPP